ncbi:MAG: efflux RND transporter periplasmic adaptor subunit [Deltaproteobacteria bacterium]|nr:efflux RND transporter periplasmic adaptor subunit [Deltaproteobacteria bacterium]
MKKQIRKWTLSGIIILACIGWLTIENLVINQAAAQDEAPKSEKERTSVVTTPSRLMTFEKRIETYGNVGTKNFSLVSARIPGVIDEIFVEEGDYVIKDETPLFQMDKIKVSQAWEIARQAVAVADYGYRARTATIVRINADLEKAEIDYERFKRLYEADQAVTKNAFESQESRYKQLRAALDEARASADLALRQKEQARNQLIIAQKDLEDSLVKAPITGHVSERLHEPGEMVGAGISVLRIDDLSILEISGLLPAQYYSSIIKDQTMMLVSVNGTAVGKMPVTYRSPTIDSKLRTFEVKSLLERPKEGVVPGSMARMSVLLESRKGVGLPVKAVLRRSGHDIVFTAEGNKAKMVQVRTGMETDGWIEITSGSLRAGAPVITMGQDKLNDGSSINVIGEDSN